MLLTDRERDFLAAFIQEATTDPFKGPATAELHRRDIYYTDLSHLLTAYYREHAQEGLSREHHAHLPACPWKDRDALLRRDHEIEALLEASPSQSVS